MTHNTDFYQALSDGCDCETWIGRTFIVKWRNKCKYPKLNACQCLATQQATKHKDLTIYIRRQVILLTSQQILTLRVSDSFIHFIRWIFSSVVAFFSVSLMLILWFFILNFFLFVLYCCVCAWFSAAVKLFVGNESEFYDRKNRSKNEINGKSCNTIPDLHKHPRAHT